MKKIRFITISVIVFLMIIFTSITIYERSYLPPEKALNYFSKLIKYGKIRDLNLTIYYMSPSFFTLMPTSIDDLTKIQSKFVTVINVSNLEDHVDLLKQISSDALIPIKNESRIDARFYYVFKNKFNRKIFDVAMWGDDYNVYVNGFEFKSNDIFYDIVMPFLSEDMVTNLEVNRDDAKRVNRRE